MPNFATNASLRGPQYKSFYSLYGKRTLDFTVVLFSLVCLLIVMQRTSPFFLQKRIGRVLKPSYIIKFKTMKDIRNAEGLPLPDEQRTIFLGSLLRSNSLDELPELINILLNNMSFIVPRPWIPEQMSIFTPSAWRKSMSLRPGITGLAQVHGRNNLIFR